MNLRTRLLVTVIVASLLVILLIMVLPNYLVKRTIAASTNSTEELLNRQQVEGFDHQLQELSSQLLSQEEEIKAIFQHIKENESLFSSKQSTQERWDFVTKLMSQNSILSMVQLYAKDEIEVMTFVPAYLHNGILMQLDDHEYVISSKLQSIFSAKLLENSENQLYGLLDIKNKNSLPINQNAITSEHAETSFSQSSLLIKKNRLIENLTKLANDNSFVGLFFLENENKGKFILKEQIYSTTALFDPTTLDDKAKMIKKDGNVQIVYSKKLDDTLISLGYALLPHIRELAIASSSTVLINANGYWLGYDPKGNSLNPSYVQELSLYLSLERINKYGDIHLIKHTLEAPPIEIVQVFSTEKISQITKIFYRFAHLLSHQLLQQMLVIGIVIMIILWLYFLHFSHSIIQPLQMLASATSLLAKGRFKEISVPRLGKRKDEVAELTHGFENMVEQLKEQEKVRAVLNKVVSKDIADEILKGQVQLGGEDRVVSMLFCDVRNFTSQTELLPPQETIRLLNFYMTKISEIIEGEGGLIDKYIGDEVMALFGAPIDSENHAMKAIASGMLIIKKLQNIKEIKMKNNELALEVGIGIHTGLVVAGNMGAESRLNYTVLGSNVNLAARLCQVAQANQLLISEHTLEENSVRDSFEVKAIEPIKLKGFAEPVKVYEVIGFSWNQ